MVVRAEQESDLEINKDVCEIIDATVFTSPVRRAMGQGVIRGGPGRCGNGRISPCRCLGAVAPGDRADPAKCGATGVCWKATGARRNLHAGKSEIAGRKSRQIEGPE